MNNICDICSNKCVGIENYHGGCCSLDNRNWILGPHNKNDISEFLEKLSNKFGRKIKYEEVFIDFEEGSKLFPDKNMWQDPLCYPALRVDMNSERKFCIFYNKENKSCNVYDIRPKICQNYMCSYLKQMIGK